MPRSQGLETEKEEVPDNDLHFLELSVKANDDVRASEVLLCVLEQLNEGLLGAVAELLHRHIHIQPALPEYRFPRRQFGRIVAAGHAELEPLHERFSSDAVGLGTADLIGVVIVGVVVVLGIQSVVFGVRGILYFPHSSALWDIATGVGSIRSTVWARHPA